MTCTPGLDDQLPSEQPQATEVFVPRECGCEHCKLSDRIDQVKASKDFEQACAMIDELANILILVQEDENYHQAVLDGGWPSSVEILERALANARSFRKQQEAKEAAECQTSSTSSPATK